MRLAASSFASLGLRSLGLRSARQRSSWLRSPSQRLERAPCRTQLAIKATPALRLGERCLGVRCLGSRSAGLRSSTEPVRGSRVCAVPRAALLVAPWVSIVELRSVSVGEDARARVAQAEEQQDRDTHVRPRVSSVRRAARSFACSSMSSVGLRSSTECRAARQTAVTESVQGSRVCASPRVASRVAPCRPGALHLCRAARAADPQVAGAKHSRTAPVRVRVRVRVRARVRAHVGRRVQEVLR